MTTERRTEDRGRGTGQQAEAQAVTRRNAPIPTFIPPQSAAGQRAVRECLVCGLVVRGAEFDAERDMCRGCAAELGEAEEPSALLVDEAETAHAALTEESTARARGLGVAVLLAAAMVALAWGLALALGR